MNLLNFRNLILLLIAFTSGIFLSPKWTIAIAAWIHYTVLLRFFRENNWKGFLIAIPILTLSAFIGQIDVIPLGVLPVFVMMLIGNTVGLLPYIIDRIMFKKLPDWCTTLVFPTTYTCFAYLMDMGPQGTWGNSAYTQYAFLPILQVASITGIYGINFLMTWFASFINYCYEQNNRQKKINSLTLLMPATLAATILFGFFQLNKNSQIKSTTSLATISLENLAVVKTMYECETGTPIDLPKYFAQSDPIVTEMQKGMIGFMAQPDAPKFKPVYPQMDQILDKYMKATRKAAQSGAKIITWSEAAIINIKTREQLYEKQIASLAKELEIYLFFPTAVFHPEKVGKEDRFIENKVLTFNPDGELVNTYFKNIPVMGVEPSFPGDGIIPIIKTPYGNLSPIICYDADHPNLIAQISDQDVDLLVVPTGDWKAISPYHTYMAAVRCIENGVSMQKATSNGLSAIINDKGRILAAYDFFEDEEVKMIVHKTPIQSSNTLYAVTGPMFINLVFIIFGMLCLVALIPIKLFKKSFALTESI